MQTTIIGSLLLFPPSKSPRVSPKQVRWWNKYRLHTCLRQQYYTQTTSSYSTCSGILIILCKIKAKSPNVQHVRSNHSFHFKSSYKIGHEKCDVENPKGVKNKRHFRKCTRECLYDAAFLVNSQRKMISAVIKCPWLFKYIQIREEKYSLIY